MTVKHAYQTAIANNPAKDVSATRWNEDHDVTGLLANPVTEPLVIAQGDPDSDSLRVVMPTGTYAAGRPGLRVVDENGGDIFVVSTGAFTFTATELDGGVGPNVTFQGYSGSSLQHLQGSSTMSHVIGFTGRTTAFEDDGVTARIGFYGATAIPRPEVPASPTVQDVVDALVALGLVTQAV
jgi:hypothetical protein